MNREEKITAIYKEMANKEVSFGCIAKHTTKRGISCDVIFIGQIITGEKYFVGKDTLYKDVEGFYENDGKFEVIGHPVMIGDVIYYIRKKYWNNHSWFHSDRSKLVDLWSKERTPIEDQSDECIDFIYSLIGNKNE